MRNAMRVREDFDLITDSFVRLCIGPWEKALQKTN